MQSVINLVFRGLLVFHQIGGGNTGQPAVMEVGMLPAEDHYARIITMKDGYRVDTKCLFPRTPDSKDCLFEKAPPTQQVYQIKIDDPVRSGVTLLIDASIPSIDRTKPTLDETKSLTMRTPYEEDFRWILDIENKEFPYNNLDDKLDFSKLKFVIRIPAGEFYTAAQSLDSLDRKSSLEATPRTFGYIAGIIGCRIKVNSGGAGLYGTIKNGAGQYEIDPMNQIIPFRSGSRYSYEIANSPSDTYTTPGDHFPHYYELFKMPPNEMFYFKSSVAKDKGPNPALCGTIYLSQTSNSLTTSLPAASKPAQQTRRKKRKSSRPVPDKKHRHL